MSSNHANPCSYLLAALLPQSLLELLFPPPSRPRSPRPHLQSFASCLRAFVPPCLLPLHHDARATPGFSLGASPAVDGPAIQVAHRMVFTAYLQDDGLSDASSVTVNQLNVPSLHGALPGMGAHQPAGGGGITIDAGCVGVAQQDSHAAPALGGKLEPAGHDPREAWRSRHDGGDSLAAQRFRNCPQQIARAVGVQKKQVCQGDPMACQGGGINFPRRVAPADKSPGGA